MIPLQLGEVITAASKPDYDTPLWPFDSAWGCEEWVLWHKTLVARYGLAYANNTFMVAWNKQSALAQPYNWCKYSSSFVNYFKSQGINMGHLISSLVTKTSETTDHVTDGAVSISKGVSNTASMLKYVLPMLIIGAGLMAYQVYGKPVVSTIKKAARKP